MAAYTTAVQESRRQQTSHHIACKKRGNAERKRQGFGFDSFVHGGSQRQRYGYGIDSFVQDYKQRDFLCEEVGVGSMITNRERTQFKNVFYLGKSGIFLFDEDNQIC